MGLCLLSFRANHLRDLLVLAVPISCLSLCFTYSSEAFSALSTKKYSYSCQGHSDFPVANCLSQFSATFYIATSVFLVRISFHIVAPGFQAPFPQKLLPLCLFCRLLFSQTPTMEGAGAVLSPLLFSSHSVSLVAPSSLKALSAISLRLSLNQCFKFQYSTDYFTFPLEYLLGIPNLMCAENADTPPNVPHHSGILTVHSWRSTLRGSKT